MLYVTVGTGIGVGVVLHGQLYRGVDDFHPEIGHQVIDANGPQCYCGATGCWEVLARGPAMTEWIEAQTSTEGAGLYLDYGSFAEIQVVAANKGAQVQTAGATTTAGVK